MPEKKHAYLIIAYTEYDLLNKLIMTLDDFRSDIYIHFNKDSLDFNKDLIFITKKSNLYFLNHTSISWNQESQLKCTIDLFKEANQNNKYQYYHLLSGTDLPLKSQDYINDFFDRNKDCEYISAFEIETSNEYNYSKFKYHHIFHDATETNFENELTYKQKKNDINCTIGTNLKYYKSSPFFSLTNRAVEYIIANEEFIIKYFYCFSDSDENCIVTLLMNSPFKYKISFKDMRMINWISDLTPAKPYIWRSKDYTKLIESEYIFARNFSSAIDCQIIEKIINYVMDNKSDFTDCQKILFTLSQIEEYFKYIKNTNYIVVLVLCGSITKTLELTKSIKHIRNCDSDIPFEPGMGFSLIIDLSNKCEKINIEKNAYVEYNNGFDIKIISKGYSNEFSAGQAIVKINNTYNYMENNSGLNVYTISNSGEIIDNVCFGGYIFNTIYARRPHLLKTNNIDDIKDNQDEEIIKLKISNSDDNWNQYQLVKKLLSRPINSDVAFSILLRLCEKEYPLAQQLMGNFYLNGKIVKKDMERGLELYNASFTNGNMDVIPDLIDALWNKNDVKSNDMAFAILQQHMDSSNSNIIMRMARAYRFGRGIDINIEESIKWMRKCVPSSPWWFNEYSDTLLQSDNIENWKEAYDLISNNLDKTGAWGLALLSKMYYYGKYVELNYDLALYYIKAATDKDLVWANEYYSMVTNKKSSKEEINDALYNCELLANIGNSLSMVYISRAYRDGILLNRNMDEAINWMKKAYLANKIWIVQYIDLLLISNKPLCYIEAREMCEKEETSNNPGIIRNLARIYHDGLGVNKNLIKASDYINKAASIDSLWSNEKIKYDEDLEKYKKKVKIIEKAITLNQKLDKIRNRLIVNNDFKGYNIISLGYNCEISQILKHCFGDIDSYPWSWAYCDSTINIINTIETPNIITNGRYSSAFNNHGILFENVGLKFHSRGEVNINDPKDPNLVETINRVNHLIDKFINIQDEDKPIVFFIKMHKSNDICNDIINIRKKLDIHFKNSILAVILSVEHHDTIFKKIDNVEIYYIDYYSDVELTDIDCCFEQWFDIVCKYANVSKLYYVDRILYSLFNKILFNFSDIFIKRSERIINNINQIIDSLIFDDRIKLKYYYDEMLKNFSSFENIQKNLKFDETYQSSSNELIKKFDSFDKVN